MWPWVALPGLSGRSPPQTYKKPELIRPVSTAPGCPPTGLVPPWTYPIPIAPPPDAFFDQASLSTSASRTLPWLEKVWRRRPARSVALPTLAAGRRSNPQARRPRYVLVRSPRKTQTRNPSEVRNPASQSALRQPTSAIPSFRSAYRIRNREDA